MRYALNLAEQAESKGEVPVGAVVVKDNVVVGEGFNQPISACDPSAHAEIMALRDAASNLGNYRLVDCTLYVTIEPCTMCAGALVHGRIKRLVYGAAEPRAGVIESNLELFAQSHLNHYVACEGGILADACSAIMSGFFKNRRRS